MQTGTVTVRSPLGGVVAHYSRFRPFYAAVFAMPVPLTTAMARVEALASELAEHMRVDALIPPEVDIRMASLFIAGGWTTVLTEWVLGHVEATEEQVTEHMVELAPEWLYRLR